MKFAMTTLLATLLTIPALAATGKTHGCAGNNGGGDVTFVDVVVSDSGRKFLRVSPGKGATRHFAVTRETQGTVAKLEGWEVDAKTGKTLSASISMEVPDRASLQGELSLDGRTRKVRCSRVKAL